MSQNVRPIPLYTQVDITSNPAAAPTPVHPVGLEQTQVLREILSAMDRQNELLEELVSQSTQQQRQRDTELKKWRQEHPQLARGCRTAVQSLGQIHSDMLTSMTTEINNNVEDLREGDYSLSEFVDRYGPRLAHLTGMLHVLSQLGFPANAPPTE